MNFGWVFYSKSFNSNARSLVTVLDLASVSFFHSTAVFCRMYHIACQYAHSVLYRRLAQLCRKNQNDYIILLAMQAQCAELLI